MSSGQWSVVSGGDTGAVSTGASGSSPTTTRIVLGVGASISAYKAADLCSKLVQDGATVYPILTRAALKFVGAPTFWGLAGQPVSTDTFDEPFGPQEIAHLRYAELADIFVIAPASADVLSRLAAGAGDDMLSCALLARTTQPVLVCPAMNTDMWNHPATQRNRKILEGYGYTFLEPGVGRLAEGVVGAGRLPEPADIVVAIRETLAHRGDLAGLNILVTAGPTREPIDPVRFLSNRSSGKMGYAVAAVAAERGAKVTLVSGPVSLPAPPNVEIVRVQTAEEMADAVLGRSDHQDVIVQAAAVADFRPVQVADQKLKKRNGVSAIELKETMDIAAVVGKRKRPGQTLVGFAAETNDLLANAETKITSKNLDLIVANDVTEPGAGFETDTNRVTFLAPGIRHATPLLSKGEVARELWNQIMRLRSS